MAASAEQHDAAPRTPRRVGIVSTDPLRILGLQAILGSEATAGQPQTDVVELSAPGLLHAAGLSIVFLDSDAIPHLLELLGSFKRARPDLHLIVLGSDAGLESIERIIAAGARGYLVHTATEAELRMALAIVEDGSVWAPRKVMARLLAAADKSTQHPSTQPSPPPRLELTTRETEVLSLLVAGRSNREIAEALHIDVGTVKAHMGRLMRKVGVKNRIALTVQALQYGSDLKTDERD